MPISGHATRQTVWGIENQDAANELIAAINSGGGSVATSVFGRQGVVVAASGDYTAAQVTNAVDSSASYTNPSWITSLAGSKISTDITTNAASINGTITESQVTGLVTDLAAKAASISDGTLENPPLSTGIAGYFFLYNPLISVVSNIPGTTGRSYAVPWIVTKAVTINQIGVGINTVGESGSVLRFALYSDNNWYPGALVQDFGTVAADSGGSDAIAWITGLTRAVTPGIYWIAYVCQVSVTTRPKINQFSTVPFNLVFTAAPSSGVQTSSCYSADSITAGFPDPYPTTRARNSDQIWRIAMRIA